MLCKIGGRSLNPFWLLIIFYLLTSPSTTLAQEKHNHREYEEGHQFPEGSEHLEFARTVTYSAYMGQMKYAHLPLLFESMKWNAPHVKFVIINIIAG
jgi:hypothetical protein